MTNLPKTRLRTTLIAWTVVAASIPALLVAVPLVGYIRWTTERAAVQELDLQASKVALSLGQDVDSLLASARGAASDSDVQRVMSSMLFMNRVDRLFADMIDKQPLIHEIRLLSKEGQVVSVAPAERAGTPTPIATTSQVQDMVARHQRVSAARMVDENLVLFLPVLGLVGDIAGALTITVARTTLAAGADRLVDDAAVHVLLAGADVQVDAGTLSATAPLKLAGATREGPALYQVRVEEPAERRLLPVRLLTIRLSAGVAILVLLFAMAGWFGIQRLTAPLENLTRLVREVAQGRYLAKAPAVPFQELQDFAETLSGLGQAVTAQMETIREQEQVKSELQRAQVQAELDAMRSQMNPHFLFNSLNSVSTMTSFAPERAQAMITRLADLYRGILDSSKTATSPLPRELEIATNYLELEKMRFGDRLSYEVAVPNGLEEVHVPGLLLQTLVENAVKHGIAPSREGGRVKIVVEMDGTGLYRMSVRNTGAALAKKKPASSGTGIENSKRRLELLYGPAHAFELARDGAGETVASFLFTGEKK